MTNIYREIELPKIPAKTHILAVRISSQMKRQLAARARKEKTTLSGFVIAVLSEALEK